MSNSLPHAVNPLGHRGQERHLHLGGKLTLKRGDLFEQPIRVFRVVGLVVAHARHRTAVVQRVYTCFSVLPALMQKSQ
jgi:hypothetical protein